MIVKVGVSAGDGHTVGEVLSFEGLAVGRQDELRLLARRGGAFFQGGERGRRFAFGANLDVDVVPLQDAVAIGFNGAAAAEPLERRLLVAERFER